MPFGGMLTMGLLSAGGSILGGLFGGNKNTQTPQFSPLQQQMQTTASNAINAELQPGAANSVFGPAQTAGIGQINQAYEGLTKQMQRGLTDRGFGNSGKLALNTENLGIQRAGQIGGLNAQIAQEEGQYNQNAVGQALNFAFNTPGQQYTQGSALGNGLTNGLQTMGTMYMLNNMLGAGGGTVNPSSYSSFEPIGQLDTSMAGI